jgi:hypothetical protein
MQSAVVVKGHLVGPTAVELEEAVPGATGEVEVIVRLSPAQESQAAETIFQFLRRLPAGTRTKADIDRQLEEERNSWDRRP